MLESHRIEIELDLDEVAWKIVTVPPEVIVEFLLEIASRGLEVSDIKDVIKGLEGFLDD